MSTLPLFLFGTLCHPPLRKVVLGKAYPGRPVELPGYRARWVAGAPYPRLFVASDARAQGLLIEDLDAEAVARADYFERSFGYALSAVSVETAGQRAGSGVAAVAAQAYFPTGAKVTSGADWSLADWAERWGEIWCAAAEEAMSYFGKIDHEELGRRWTMIILRAASRVRAAEGGPYQVRAGFTADRDVRTFVERRPYANYFTLEEHDLSFRRFDGTMSAPVNRAAFVGGDAATVLPYDPASDRVLVVEQFRTGPLMRGDPRPWTLEPIAGRIDPGEAPEDCVYREAVEEAGLTLGALHPVVNYYPSPGAVTEFIYAYVGLADLGGRGGEIGGMDHEDEDIRAHVLDFDELMALIASGEVANGPLILTAYWLAAHRSRLRAEA